MDDSKKNLKGSPSRDAFKHWHKTLSSNLYGCDLDFILINKYPEPKIIAAIDYKDLGDSGISFSECIAYNDLKNHYPIYIVYTREPFEQFAIWQYLSGNPYPDPPQVKLKHVCNLTSKNEYEKWEFSIRKKS